MIMHVLKGDALYPYNKILKQINQGASNGRQA
jgi:hypothetical protein